MLLLTAASASFIMLTALRVESRRGPAAGGWTAALPLGLLVALVAVSLDQGTTTAGAVSMSAAGHAPAQVAFGIVVGAVMKRVGTALGAALGILAFAAASWALTHVPSTAGALTGAALLVALSALPPRHAPAPPGRRSRTATVVVCACAAAIVLATTITARMLGPDVGGTVGAFPTMCLGLTLVVATLATAADGANVAYGLLRSLPCYLTFAATFGATAPSWGALAFPAALASAVVTAAATWSLMQHQLRRVAHRASTTPHVAVPSAV